MRLNGVQPYVDYRSSVVLTFSKVHVRFHEEPMQPRYHMASTQALVVNVAMVPSLSHRRSTTVKYHHTIQTDNKNTTREIHAARDSWQGAQTIPAISAASHLTRTPPHRHGTAALQRRPRSLGDDPIAQSIKRNIQQGRSELRLAGEDAEGRLSCAVHLRRAFRKRRKNLGAIANRDGTETLRWWSMAMWRRLLCVSSVAHRSYVRPRGRKVAAYCFVFFVRAVGVVDVLNEVW